MSSGGMDWACRLVATAELDAMGVAIVLYLGWRDAPNFRTDRGIARGLNRDRRAVQRATAKLCEAGIIERRSGQWVACETIKIVEGQKDAKRPDSEHSDEEGAVCDRRAANAVSSRRSEAAPPGGQKPPLGAVRSRPYEKREQKKGRGRAKRASALRSNPAPLPCEGQGLALTLSDLGSFQRAQLRDNKPLVLRTGQTISSSATVYVKLAAQLASEQPVGGRHEQ